MRRALQAALVDPELGEDEKKLLLERVKTLRGLLRERRKKRAMDQFDARLMVALNDPWNWTCFNCR